MSSDPYHLQRFVDAQEAVYASALAEIEAGFKKSHWMWFIFPQLAGLGESEKSQYYGLQNLAEAEAYLAHPVLGPRLLACARAALEVQGRDARELFGFPDNLKLRSSATLFALASPPDSVFEQLLQKYFAGQRDEKTLQLLATA